jgi:PAT family beta-lactamase induction signal transducer AmpG
LKYTTNDKNQNQQQTTCAFGTSLLRYLSFAILYVGQGIPEGMTVFGIPAWMAMNGKTPAEIGVYTAIIFIHLVSK